MQTLETPDSSGWDFPGTGSVRQWISPKRAGRIAGISYLAMFLLAVFANFVVLETMVVANDGPATLANISESLGMFRLGAVAFLAIALLDVVIAWALYVVFRNVNRDLALISGWFRLAYGAILGVAVAALFRVVQLVSGDLWKGQAGDTDAAVLEALSTFESIWIVGLAAFGIHLVLLGVLALRSRLVTKVIGYSLVVAGVAYVLDTFAFGLLANYQDLEGVFQAAVAVPSIVGEVGLGVWLLCTSKLDRAVANPGKAPA